MRSYRALKAGYHVLTIRFLSHEFEQLKKKRAEKQKKTGREVTYTEVVIDAVCSPPRGRP